MIPFVKIYEAGRISRYHTVPHAGQHQNIADHTWGVLMIAYRLWHEAFSSPGSTMAPFPDRLLRAILFHDTPELETGDVPAHAKWRHFDLSRALNEVEKEVETEWFGGPLNEQLSREEYFVLKFSDTLELLQHAVHQNRLGNSYFLIIVERAENYINHMMESERSPIKEPILNLKKEIING